MVAERRNPGAVEVCNGIDDDCCDVDDADATLDLSTRTVWYDDGDSMGMAVQPFWVRRVLQLQEVLIKPVIVMMVSQRLILQRLNL